MSGERRRFEVGVIQPQPRSQQSPIANVMAIFHFMMPEPERSR